MMTARNGEARDCLESLCDTGGGTYINAVKTLPSACRNYIPSMRASLRNSVSLSPDVNVKEALTTCCCCIDDHFSSVVVELIKVWAFSGSSHLKQRVFSRS